MGLSFGPTLANVFLCHYKKLQLDYPPPEFNPVIYRRYVDHIFVQFKSKDHLLLFTRYMNTRHKKLKFTFDFEQNNSLSFLDVEITCGNSFSVKPHLVEFSQTLIASFPSLIKQVLFLGGAPTSICHFFHPSVRTSYTISQKQYIIES